MVTLRAILLSARTQDEGKDVWYDKEDGHCSFSKGLLQECYSYLRCMGFDLAKGQTEDPSLPSNWRKMISVEEQSALVDAMGAMRTTNLSENVQQQGKKFGMIVVRDFIKITMKFELPDPKEAFDLPVKPSGPHDVLAQTYRFHSKVSNGCVGGGCWQRAEQMLRVYPKTCWHC